MAVNKIMAERIGRLQSCLNENKFYIEKIIDPNPETEREPLLMIGVYHPNIIKRTKAEDSIFERSLANVLNAYHNGDGTTLLEVADNYYKKYNILINKYMLNWSEETKKKIGANEKRWEYEIKEIILKNLSLYNYYGLFDQPWPQLHYWSLVKAKKVNSENYAERKIAEQFSNLFEELNVKKETINHVKSKFNELNERRNISICNKIKLSSLNEPTSLVLGETHFSKNSDNNIMELVGEDTPYLLLKPRKELSRIVMKSWGFEWDE